MGKKKLLKNMTLSSVDLCSRGCNPHANIKLTKSANLKGGENMKIDLIAISKAFQESCESIENDVRLTAEEKNTMFGKTLFEMNDYVSATLAKADPKSRKFDESGYVKGAKADIDDDMMDGIEEEDDMEDDGSSNLIDNEEEEDEIEKNSCKLKKGNDLMATLDVTKMSTEDKATLDILAKKYSGKDEAKEQIHPDVKKALDEVADLRKQLDLKGLEEKAKKYEIIGKKAPEMADKFYDLKKAGGTAYDDYVAILDEMVEQQNSNGIFKSIGSDKSGSKMNDLNSAVAEIKKSNPTMSQSEAIELAYRNNPELPETY